MELERVKRYKAKYITPDGREVAAVFIANNKDTIVKDLESQGNTVIGVSVTLALSFHKNTERVRAFFRNLYDLLKSGYSLNSALEILFKNETDVAFKSVIKDILDTVSRGYGFVDGLRVHSEWFSTAITTMIETGERAGKLTPVIEECIKYIDKEMEISKSITSQLAAPLFTLMFGIAILFFNVIVTIPKIMKSSFYKELMVKSASTGIEIVKITAKLTPIVGVALLLFILIIVVLYRIRQEKVEQFLLKVPIVKSVWFNREIFLLYFSLSKLLQVGVNLDIALEIVAQNARLKKIKSGLLESVKKIRNGMGIADTLPMLDDVDRSLVRSVTTTQHLSEIFANLSERKYDEYERILKRLPGIARTVTYIMLAYLFFILFLGVIVPYLKGIQYALNKI